MGWSGGTSIAAELEELILELPVEYRKKFVESTYGMLVSEDWDCVDEVDVYMYYYMKFEADKEYLEEYKEENPGWMEEMEAEWGF